MTKIIVETKNGKVLGREIRHGEKVTLACQGIPYAQPPVGELRFKKPVPVANWDYIRECKAFGSHNPYHSMSRDAIINSSEDCLFLNVFTPIREGKIRSNLPVLFYIHGGGFCWDSSDLLGDDRIAKYLCSKDVIVVTINYRLGFLGFLSWDDSFKGNYGLWDMALALKWVSDNITSFGGDSTRITVCGQSAGGVAADLLSLSPHTRDLFSQLIVFAGSADCCFAIKNKDNIKEISKEFAKHFLDYNEDKDDLFETFKHANVTDLAIGKPFGKHTGMIPIGPVIDGDFLPKSLKELRKEAPKKNVISGVTEFECLGFAMIGKQFKCNRDSVPFFVDWFASNANVDKALEIFDKHVEQEGEEEEVFRQFVIYLDDFCFGYGHHKLAQQLTERGDTIYQYVLRYFKKGSAGRFGEGAPIQGACHCLELPYLFGVSLLTKYDPAENDEKMINIFGDYLTTFIQTGNPNHEGSHQWDTVAKGDLGKHFSFELEPKMEEKGLYSDYVQEFGSLVE